MEFVVHRRVRDRAALDVHHGVPVLSKKTEFPPPPPVNGNLVAIAIGRRRGLDAHLGKVLEASDPLEGVAHLLRLDAHLLRVVRMLVGTPATSTEDRTFWLDPLRRRIEHPDEFRLRVAFFLAGQPRPHLLPRKRSGNEDDPPIGQVPHPGSAKRHVADGDLNLRSHQRAGADTGPGSNCGGGGSVTGRCCSETKFRIRTIRARSLKVT